MGFLIIFNSNWGKDEPQTLHYAITQNCSMGADIRQALRLWPANDPLHTPHSHADLPANHPHLAPDTTAAHSHAFTIDALHRHWPKHA
jgi:hypothetical protein